MGIDGANPGVGKKGSKEEIFSYEQGCSINSLHYLLSKYHVIDYYTKTRVIEKGADSKTV